jgi:hypothetical protein
MANIEQQLFEIIERLERIEGILKSTNYRELLYSEKNEEENWYSLKSANWYLSKECGTMLNYNDIKRLVGSGEIKARKDNTYWQIHIDSLKEYANKINGQTFP